MFEFTGCPVGFEEKMTKKMTKIFPKKWEKVTKNMKKWIKMAKPMHISTLSTSTSFEKNNILGIF